jgi:hypothetical protein
LNAVVYRNTKTQLPGWVSTVHVEEARGMAYETDTHFVHFYGRGSGLWVVSTGLTATEKKSGSLAEWITRVFGADQIKQSNHPVGATVAGVWRPALLYQPETLQALGNSEYDQRSAEQALRLLVERLDELLLYIEPDVSGLKTYSHKNRELLILACTEVENTWKHYMRLGGATPITGSDFTTKDYVKLLGPLFLSEFEISLKPYGSVFPMRPFLGWNAAAPTKSLPWYDAYNKTKHDRSTHFGEATLHNCLLAIAANLILFCTRFSPFPLFQTEGTLAPLVSHLFGIELRDCDPATFYVPLLSLPSNIRPDLVCGQSKDWVQNWVALPLQL